MPQVVAVSLLVLVVNASTPGAAAAAAAGACAALATGVAAGVAVGACQNRPLHWNRHARLFALSPRLSTFVSHSRRSHHRQTSRP